MGLQFSLYGERYALAHGSILRTVRTCARKRPTRSAWREMNDYYVTHLCAAAAPGRGDFAAFNLRYGEIGRFWGNQCLHYTVPNETGSCRVSFDFRIIPRSCFVERCALCASKNG